MTNETLKKQFYNEFIQKISNTFIVEDIADWWLAKLASHDALLLRRLEEKQKLGRQVSIPCPDADPYSIISCAVYHSKTILSEEEKGYNKCIEDIKLLITNKEV